MDPQIDQQNPLDHIQRLSDEEHQLYEQDSLSGADHARLKEIEVELDQCWDLLRQRRAARQAGENPDNAQLRPPETVENYLG